MRRKKSLNGLDPSFWRCTLGIQRLVMAISKVLRKKRSRKRDDPHPSVMPDWPIKLAYHWIFDQVYSYRAGSKIQLCEPAQTWLASNPVRNISYHVPARIADGCRVLFALFALARATIVYTMGSHWRSDYTG